MNRRSFQQHLEPSGDPKRILALDGGGHGTLVTLGLLRRLEAMLQERRNDPTFRLCDSFDLIAGTSSGAIVAAHLALGASVDEAHASFRALGASVGKRGLLGWNNRNIKAYSAALHAGLKQSFGNLKMSSVDFRTGLMVMTRRMDTGVRWPITNIPSGRYFSDQPTSEQIPNREYPLWQVVRASAASLLYFDPEPILVSGAHPGARSVLAHFADGGLSAANNPALQAVLMATVEGYRLNWLAGQDKLLVVSVGAGKRRLVERGLDVERPAAAVNAAIALRALMNDCDTQVEAVLQWLSVSPTAREIDREMGRAGPALGLAAQFTYLRYDVDLDPLWINHNLGLRVTQDQLDLLESATPQQASDLLEEIGMRAGRVLIKNEHWPLAFDV